MVSPETLRFFQLFAGQDYYMLKEIAMISKEITIEEGEILFKQGDPAFAMYLIQEGSVSLALEFQKNGKGVHVERMGSIGRGEVLGWSSMVNPHIYCFDAKITKTAKLIKIEAGSLRELMDDNPKYGYYFLKKINEVIGDRLRYKCIQLLSLKVTVPEKIPSKTN